MITLKTTLGAVAIVAALGLGLWSMNPRESLLPVQSAQAQETPAATDAPVIELQDMTLGQEEAPITLIEYASFTCPHCATFHSSVFKNLKTDYIDTGKVRFAYREVYFDRYGLWAAIVARCGGQMRFFGMTEILYASQQEWAGSDDPNVVVENLKRIGRTVGMEDAQMEACLADGPMAQALVDRFEAQMKEFDVQGTPTIVINGTTHGNMTYADLKVILDAELAK